MALIGFHQTGLTKDVWKVVYDGSKGSAFTALQFLNRSNDNVSVALAVSDTVTDGDTAVDGNGDLVLTNIDAVLLENTVGPGEQLYYQKTSGGTILLPFGRKLALVISGLGDVNVSISGAER